MWTARQPWWQRGPLTPEYYPLADDAQPFLIENVDTDWTPRS